MIAVISLLKRLSCINMVDIIIIIIITKPFSTLLFQSIDPSTFSLSLKEKVSFLKVLY